MNSNQVILGGNNSVSNFDNVSPATHGIFGQFVNQERRDIFVQMRHLRFMRRPGKG